MMIIFVGYFICSIIIVVAFLLNNDRSILIIVVTFLTTVVSSLLRKTLHYCCHNSSRCLYRIKIFVLVLSLIYPNIILQRLSYVIEFGYYYAHTSALSKIRHRLDSFLRVVKKIAFLNFKVEALLCGLI